jgi:hypothetical protein
MNLVITYLPFLLVGVFIDGGITDWKWWLKVSIMDMAILASQLAVIKQQWLFP